MKSFKHSHSLVETDIIGDNTRIWAFVHILPRAQIGRDCNICDHVFIENDVIIGDRVTITDMLKKQGWRGLAMAE